MDMLCIAAAHEPIGYVAVAGRALDSSAIARMTGGSESDVQALLSELDRNGVFSRDRQRRIYSRRMISDAKKAAVARENGSLGGNPRLRKDGGNPASDNRHVNGVVKPHKPEARSQELFKGSEANASADEPPDFNKQAWADAAKLFKRAGLTDAKARGVFGSLLKGGSIQARDLLPAIATALVNGTQDPVAYLKKAALGVSSRQGNDPAARREAIVRSNLL